MNVCTIIAQNYLAQARVLVETLLEQHPDATFTTLVLDGAAPAMAARGFNVVGPTDVGLDEAELHRMAAIYDVMELATAVKPWLMRHLLQEAVEPVLYLDPDIEIFAPLDELSRLAKQHGIVLTPHTTAKLPFDPEGVVQRALLQAGVYNLGFLGLGPGNNEFFAWWCQRLKRNCIVAPERGLFVDQRWFDFVPALFDHIVVDDPGLNVAWWNLDARELRQTTDGYEVDGRPLRFFHFSGFDPRQAHLLSKHQGACPPILLSEHPDLQRLCAAYAARLEAHGFSACANQGYAFDVLPNGIPFDRRMRRLYRTALLAAERKGSPEPPNPFADSEAFLAWLGDAVDTVGQAKRISRYLHAVYEGRPDLQQKFRDLRWLDGDRYLDWVASFGRLDERIPSKLVPSGPDRRGSVEESTPTTEPGVNLVGYLTAESGVGEAARQLTKAVQSAAIPYSTGTYRSTPSRQEHRREDGGEENGLPYDTNIICVNADQLAAFAWDAGPSFFARRYSIGVWWWEVAEFPRKMHSAFDIVDEVWVGSEHISSAIGAQTAKPVLVFPLPIEVPETLRLGRADVRLPSERFVFLFAFDFFSVFDRKNPLGLVQAFTRAFEPDEGPLLLIKSINGDRHLPQLELLRAAVADRQDIELRDGYVSASEMRAMMATCDAYASLHRSEGFGLTMAEAMAYGRPVVATRYSGNLTFMNDENSFLIPYELTAIPQGCEPYPEGGEWAEPDIEAAAASLRYVYEHREEAQLRGERARRDIRDRQSVDRAAAFVAARLAEIEAQRRSRSAPPARAGVTARQEAQRYLAEGPSVPIRAPSRFGSLGVLARRLLYRLLRPYLWRQREFEVALVQSLAELEEIARSESEASRQAAQDVAMNTYGELLARLEATDKRGRELGSRIEPRLGDLEAILAETRAAARQLDGLIEPRLGDLEATLAETQAAARQLDARLYARPYMSDPQLLVTHNDAGRPAIGYRDGAAPEPVYLGFENVFRGSEELVRDRQRAYVEVLAGHAPVLDIGCGRGELLQLLAEAGVEARGVDLDPEMVERAREKRVEVEEGEAVEYLESQPPGSIGAVVALQVIEHLPYEALVRFFELAHDRLVPGGLLLAETVNPHSLEASKAFWVDLTHQTPIFPEVAVTLCKLRGFESALVSFPNGSGELERDRREQSEYAVVATKSVG